VISTWNEQCRNISVDLDEIMLLNVSPAHTTTACLIGLTLLGTAAAHKEQRGLASASRLIPKRGRSSSLIKRTEDGPARPMFRLGLAEGRQVELVQRSTMKDSSGRSADYNKRAEGDEVVGAIEDLESRSG
jgi:hypothetical protein